MSIAATTPPAKHLSSNRHTMRETERVGERHREWVSERERDFYSCIEKALHFELFKGIVIGVLWTKLCWFAHHVQQQVLIVCIFTRSRGRVRRRRRSNGHT
ncbi:hypothetical protein CY35_10G095200 [Sphagnum magellanicum]|nr:hypothetical protein CY35_10G095200 [Sphagnum magellanicum]